MHRSAHVACVEELDTVESIDGDSEAVCLRLIERLLQAAVVIEEKSTVLHELDAAVLDGAAALGPIVHDRHLDG